MTVGDWAKYTSEGCWSATGSGQPGGGGGVAGEGVEEGSAEARKGEFNQIDRNGKF